MAGAHSEVFVKVAVLTTDTSDLGYAARCMRPRLVVFHGSQTWGPNNPELKQLRNNDRAMIHWICGINDRNETHSTSLLQILASRILSWSSTVSHSDGMAMYSGPCPVSNLSQTF